MLSRSLASALAILILTAGVCDAQLFRKKQDPAKPLFKHPTVDAAWQASQKSQRPMLLFIHSDNCRFCVKMEKETYSHPEISRALAATAESVSVKKEHNLELIKRLKIRAYPTTVIVSPVGKEITRVEGFLDPQKFVVRMFGVPEGQPVQRAAHNQAPSRK